MHDDDRGGGRLARRVAAEADVIARGEGRAGELDDVAGVGAEVVEAGEEPVGAGGEGVVAGWFADGEGEREKGEEEGDDSGEHAGRELHAGRCGRCLRSSVCLW